MSVRVYGRNEKADKRLLMLILIPFPPLTHPPASPIVSLPVRYSAAASHIHDHLILLSLTLIHPEFSKINDQNHSNFLLTVQAKHLRHLLSPPSAG